jgi:hypothetical protein
VKFHYNKFLKCFLGPSLVPSKDEGVVEFVWYEECDFKAGDWVGWTGSAVEQEAPDQAT